MTNFSEKKIIEGFLNNDDIFLNNLYEIFFPVIKRLIKNNSGTETEAWDIFQDALFIIFSKVKKNKFELTCSFNTYLYSICRHLWLNQIRKNRIKKVEFIDCEIFIKLTDESDIEKEQKLNLEYFLFREHFNKLDKKCKKLIKLFLKKLSFNDIAKKLNYKNAIDARRTKYLCKNLLINRIKNDPKYKELQKDEKTN
ncbi:MAG: sigma-70 family RNA polymerase sigma factor [Bacteroidales bacterium]|nr:sigma-70 family RNA polymerase sigma factor [Bacteroidales bacterium]MCK4407080.1 sigma-70 family RNA polymerase sigma factor [Bacteroidales bacterium]